LKLKQNQRTTGKEQYYTPTDVATRCTQKMIDYIRGRGVSMVCTWLEPAGGTGQFVNAIQAAGVPVANIVSYDIEPHHPLVRVTKDFLEEKVPHLNCVTLTNPPFGRANSLSIPFFNKCAEVSAYIGFLVPKSWRKWSVIDKLDEHFFLVHDEDLKTDFIYPEESEEKKGRLNTIFQIWERRIEKRSKIIVQDRGYITKTTPRKADVSMTVFGRGCGTVIRTFTKTPNTTQMFLKCNYPWVADALQAVDMSVFYNNVAFVEALSIKEINFKLNEYADARGIKDRRVESSVDWEPDDE
jgi:predicted RNA methylase